VTPLRLGPRSCIRRTGAAGAKTGWKSWRTPAGEHDRADVRQAGRLNRTLGQQVERDCIARGIFSSAFDLKRKPLAYIERYMREGPVDYNDPKRRIRVPSVTSLHRNPGVPNRIS